MDDPWVDQLGGEGSSSIEVLLIVLNKSCFGGRGDIVSLLGMENFIDFVIGGEVTVGQVLGNHGKSAKIQCKWIGRDLWW